MGIRTVNWYSGDGQEVYGGDGQEVYGGGDDIVVARNLCLTKTQPWWGVTLSVVPWHGFVIYDYICISAHVRATSGVSLKKMTSLCRTWAAGRFTCVVTTIPNIMPWSKVLGAFYTLFYTSINDGSPVKTKCVFYVIFKCGRYPKLLIGNNEIVIYHKTN